MEEKVTVIQKESNIKFGAGEEKEIEKLPEISPEPPYPEPNNLASKSCGRCNGKGVLPISTLMSIRESKSRNLPCPCNSGKKFKNCCLPTSRPRTINRNAYQLCHCVDHKKYGEMLTAHKKWEREQKEKLNAKV